MRLSQKCLYALRAVLELAKRQQAAEPVSIAAIGQAQDIPNQFLQVIMRELRQGGFVESRRGKEGGYLLARPAAELPVGDVVRFLEGEFVPRDDHDPAGDGVTAFTQLWQDVGSALDAVFDGVSFGDLMDRERAQQAASVPNYVI